MGEQSYARTEVYHRLLHSEKGLKTRSSTLKVIRGTEVGSDHLLVSMMVRLKVQSQRRCIGTRRNKLRLHKLENREVKIRFQQESRKLNRQMWEVVDHGDGDVVSWNEFSLAVTGVAERVVGRSIVRRQKKITAWWYIHKEAREVVKLKINLYRIKY